MSSPRRSEVALPLYACDVANSPFDRNATAEDVTVNLDLTGKTALLTGSSSGIGLETLRVLVLRGAHVLAFAPNMQIAEQACERVMTPGVKGKATPVACEQTHYSAVAIAANLVQALNVPLDMLICNAGINAPKLTQVYGIEKHFAVHHLSHFILVSRLLTLVKAAPQGRIVMVGSIMYKDAPPVGIEFDNLSGERGEYDMFRAYGQSKLANGLFGRALARRLCGCAATANVLHPGLVPTGIGHTWVRDGQVDAQFKARMEVGMGRVSSIMPPDSFIKSLSQGAATTCYVATHPTLAYVNGGYFEDCRIVAPGGHMQDDAMAEKLWTVSEDLTKQYL